MINKNKNKNIYLEFILENNFKNERPCLWTYETMIDKTILLWLKDKNKENKNNP